jgi:hypothetical protein
LRYFFSVFAEASEQAQTEFFVAVTSEQTGGAVPVLTKEMLHSDSVYKAFLESYKPKRVLVMYKVYSTESDFSKLSPVVLTDHFMALIEHNKAELVVQSAELDIDYSAKAKKTAKARQNTAKLKSSLKKLPKIAYGIGGGAVLLSLIVGIAIGSSGASKINVNTEKNGDNFSGKVSEDGMILPDEVYINPNAEQITVFIDRSYSPIPKEDLQLKGEVKDGKAVIELPYFDPTDFFSHVEGYTWGFSQDPKAEKIQYRSGKKYEFTENTKLYRVLVKYGGGTGTKDDPYIIDYFDQLELLASESARGYFKQTADLIFPTWANHTPINTVNTLKSDVNSEYFEYDGGGYSISGLTVPLFGKVSGAVIKNVNITNAIIQSIDYKNYGFIVCEAYNYRYETGGKMYETGETVLQNCSVSNSEISLKYIETGGEIQTVPAVAPPYESENDEEEISEILQKISDFAIGGITGLGGEISNCFVTNVTISAEHESYFSYVGGIAGKPANVRNCGVFGVSVSGKIFTSGGICGSAGGGRLYNAAGEELPVFYGGNIQGCFVRGFVGFTENATGGIVGQAGSEAQNPLISNCYATNLDLRAGVFEDATRTKPIKLGFSEVLLALTAKTLMDT